MDQDQASRPEKIGTAVKLLYITLGIGVLRSIMEASMHAQMASPALVMFITFFVLGIMWLFIYMIGKGRNWARIAFLALFIIGIPFSVLPLLQSLAANPISGLLGIGQTVIQIIALVFLLQKPSSDWFKAMKMKSISDWKPLTAEDPRLENKQKSRIIFSSWKTTITWIVTGLFVLMFIGLCSYQTKHPTPTTNNEINQTMNESLTEVSAFDLAREYEQNTVAADQKFKGKRFRVTGTVVDINTDFLGNPYLVLSGGVNQFSNPQFEFDKKLVNSIANLRKGEQVVLVCEGKGDIAKTPMSDSCIFSQ